nr:hybrid signal transduction histidine kinase b [Quercus suber]
MTGRYRVPPEAALGASVMSGAVKQQRRRFRLRTEHARERDVFRHLHPWIAEYRPTSLDRQAFPADDAHPLPEPMPCPDTALVAFAQLCALRLRARRCFVTLTSTNVEYILAEATKTMSLQYDAVEDVRDLAWLGTCSFLRDDGLSTGHMETWRRARQLREVPEDNDHFYTDSLSPHWHIISDIRSHEVYNRRKFVLRSPALRFYAAVPLRGAFGSVLGSLTVVDDIPRYGVSAVELSFMEDVADTITQHLDATLVRSQRQRSERMVQALGLFNSGKSSLRHWWLKQEDNRNANIGRHGGGIQPADERTAAADREFGPNVNLSSSDKEMSSSPDRDRQDDSDEDEANQPHTVNASASSLHNSHASVTRAAEHISGQDFGERKSIRRPVTPLTALDRGSIDDSLSESEPKTERSPKLDGRATKEGFDHVVASQLAYARASNLMREALGAYGVVFVNTCLTAPGSHISNSARSTASDHIAQPPTSEGDNSDSYSSAASHVAVHAFSTVDESTVRGSQISKSQFKVSQTFLANLIRRYPNGHIFNFTEDGSACSSSNEENATSGSASNSDQSRSTRQHLPRDGQRLGEIMVGAKTIAFYPLWDETLDRFSSAVFVWSTSPLRYFDPVEDVTYLASWGHSVLAELRRLETIATDKAKSTFISSVSHELRSPLHGVLAGVEFLEDTELTSFQQEMTHTIAMAGRALLDTVDHILDHAKMSTFTRAHRSRRTKTRDGRSMADSAYRPRNAIEDSILNSVSLAQLTEEVVETVVSAHRFQHNHQSDANDLSVIMNIPWRESWNVHLSVGGWTRIVQNLVGNALKYTQKGVISIRLDVDEMTLENHGTSNYTREVWRVRFSVEDTGIGIGKHFLAYGLYTPFRQENAHSSGTGLGLSITRQICQDMGAKLEITSELGMGTKANVDLVVPFVPAELQSKMARTTHTTGVDERKLNVGHYHLIVPKFDLSNERSNDDPIDLDDRVGGSILETAKEWLSCDVSRGVNFTTSDATKPWIYAITEGHLSRWVREDANDLSEKLTALAKASSHVLVLGSSFRSVSIRPSLSDLPFTPVFVHQPIGPQKLLRAIVSDQSSTLLGTSNSAAVDENLSNKTRQTNAAPKLPSKTSVSHSPAFPRVIARNPDATITTGHPKQEASITMNPLPSTPGSSIAENSFSLATYGKQRSGTPLSTASLVSRRAKESMSFRSSDDENALMVPEAISQTDDKVLLVEDNDINMKLLVALMHKQNLLYECAVNGCEAVDKYRASPSSFFLILMDISMPVMDGLTATANIRKMEDKLQLPRTFIAALTGVTSDDTREWAFDCGVDEFFSKPVHMREVKMLVLKEYVFYEATRHYVMQMLKRIRYFIAGCILSTHKYYCLLEAPRFPGSEYEFVELWKLHDVIVMKHDIRKTKASSVEMRVAMVIREFQLQDSTHIPGKPVLGEILDTLEQLGSQTVHRLGELTASVLIMPPNRRKLIGNGDQKLQDTTVVESRMDMIMGVSHEITCKEPANVKNCIATSCHARHEF